MFFRHALDDALIYMKEVWLNPASPAVLGTVTLAAAAILALRSAGAL